MHIAVYVEVGYRGKGEVDILLVGPQVDAVFSVVQRHRHQLRCLLQRFPADDGQCVVGGVGHPWLNHVHQVGKGLVVVALEDVVLHVYRCRAAGAGQRILLVAGLRHLYRRSRVHDVLEVADADIRHVWHVVVESQHHHALRLTLGIHHGHHAFHIHFLLRDEGVACRIVVYRTGRHHENRCQHGEQLL